MIGFIGKTKMTWYVEYTSKYVYSPAISTNEKVVCSIFVQSDRKNSADTSPVHPDKPIFDVLRKLLYDSYGSAVNC